MPKRKVSLEGAQPKPSLSSLKPEKGTGEAAKRRAVKRIVATASVKASATRIKKISDAFPQAVLSPYSVRRSTKVAPTVATKQVRAEKSKSPVSEKKVTPTEKVSTSRRATAKKIVPDTPKQRPDFLVKLPTTMSIRAREKALVLLQQAIHDFQKPAQQIAHVSGFCFVVLGSYLALSFSGILPSMSGQSAMLMQTAGTTSPTSLETSKQFKAPVFTLIENIPPELSTTAQYTFSLSNVKNVAVKIFSISSASQIDAGVDELVPGTRRYTIEAGKLEPGSYVVKATAESDTDLGRYTYELGEFSVPGAPTASASSTGSSTPATALDTSTSTEPLTQTGSSTERLTEVHSTMRLVADAELSGQKTIQISAPKDARFVEIYVRPVRSINARFLGLAEKKTENWYYFFNTINVPNGDYELFARTHIKDSFFESNSVNTRIVNIAKFEMPEINDGSKPLEEGQTIDDVATPVRTFSDYSFEDASAAESAGGDVAKEADAIFAKHNSELNDVLKRYSVAVQSGDALLTKTALDELSLLKSEILLEVLNDSSLNYLADNISTEFDERLENIKKRIATFEELRRKAGAEGVRLDLDKDGITDFDERNLYRTDPEQADTDNDGVTDGIEIMRGFDPRSPLGESVINYELPQEVLGLSPSDVLHIDSVQPLLNHLSDTESIVQAEIKGLALPNSYVTLYVFSNPNITTVRTDENGAFSYTFEKELEDGEHEVYAAVTDNSGKLVAASAPYKFVKRAGIFTSAASVQNESNTVSLGDFAKFNALNAIIGIGIIALGIILLVLGSSLKRRDDELEMAVPAPSAA